MKYGCTIRTFVCEDLFDCGWFNCTPNTFDCLGDAFLLPHGCYSGRYEDNYC